MPDEPTPIRVVLAEPAPLFREGVAALFDLRDGMELVGKTALREDALRLAERLAPDVLLADVRLLTDGAPAEPVRVVALAQGLPQGLTEERHDDALRERLLALLEAGVAGFVSSRDEVEALFEAVRAVAAGEVWISPRIAARLVPGRPDAAEAAGLTRRQRELLRRVAVGQPNERVAAELCLARGTLRNHLSALYARIGVHSRAEAVAWAWRTGLVHESGPGGSAGGSEPRGDRDGRHARS